MAESQSKEEAQAEAEVRGPEPLPQRVPDFYRGRDLLVTGGSGFVGRVLLEKLLRSCPDVGTIYVLLRARKGLSPHERLKKFTDVPLFERLRAERPGALARLVAVEGNVAQRGLGLSAGDARLLAERVSVVFHLAASVRFDEPLGAALRNNTRATRELLDLATQMPHLQALVHISTTFCNVGQQVYEERLYPPRADWRAILAAEEAADPFVLRALTDKILGQHCNTYTFSKLLAEHILNDYVDRLPIGIVRPSVVVCTASDPIPGWLDNFNGPIGLLVGAGKGVVHTGYSDPDKYIDYIPCDILVKGLLICSCEIANRGTGQLSIYQAAQSEVNRITQGDLINMAYEMGKELPFKQTLYHPCGGITRSRLLFYVQFLFFQLLPALLVDALLSATGRDRILVRLQRRIYSANIAVSYFIMRNWNFVNKNFLELEDKLQESDKADLGYHLHTIESKAFFLNALHGTRLYLMHESDDELPVAKKMYQRKRILHLTLKTLFYITIAWIILSRVNTVFFTEQDL